MAGLDTRAHEVTFCGRVGGWARAFFAEYPEWSRQRGEIEQPKAIKQKRSESRISRKECGKLETESWREFEAQLRQLPQWVMDRTRKKQ